MRRFPKMPFHKEELEYRHIVASKGREDFGL